MFLVARRSVLFLFILGSQLFLLWIQKDLLAGVPDLVSPLASEQEADLLVPVTVAGASITPMVLVRHPEEESLSRLSQDGRRQQRCVPPELTAVCQDIEYLEACVLHSNLNWVGQLPGTDHTIDAIIGLLAAP